jgi:hypothetical protein
VWTILQRDEKEFQRVLKTSDIHHVSKYNGQTALHFATEWPYALSILLEKGANINAADRYGRRPIHLAVELSVCLSVQTLLQADCALYTPVSYEPLLSTALRVFHCRFYRGSIAEIHAVIETVLSTFIDRHKRLRNLAVSLLNEESKVSINLSRDNVLDERKAPMIRKLLLSEGHEVPQALELDGVSLYEQLREKHRLTPAVASRIYLAGFTSSLEHQEENAFSPLLKSWSWGDIDMVEWFISKGLYEYSHHKGLCGLHFYASWCSLYFNISISEDRNRRILNLAEKLSLRHDNCSCHCSPGGCTPITILTKLSILLNPDFKNISGCTWESLNTKWLARWLEYFAHSKSLQEMDMRECAQVLLFEMMPI